LQIDLDYKEAPSSAANKMNSYDSNQPVYFIQKFRNLLNLNKNNWSFQ